MTTRNGLRSICASLFVLALGFTSGCALDDGLDVGEESSSIGLEDVKAPRPAESVTVDFRTISNTRYLDEGGVDVGPCECDTIECIDEWVVTNFGCDLCVSVVCDKFNGHSCNMCEEPALGSNQGPATWSEDGENAL